MQQSLLKLLKGKKWYHQRFDGCPMFIGAIAEAETRKESRKPTGCIPKVRVGFFEGGSCDWYLDMNDVMSGAKELVLKAKSDPKLSEKFFRVWKKDEQLFDNFFWGEFPKINLSGLSTQVLVKLWQRYWRLAVARFTSSSIIDHFALGTDELIEKMLKRELKVEVSLKETDFTRIFSIATAPVHQSFINLAEIDLLNIILGKSKLKLAEHRKKYFWTKNNYITAQELDIKYFEREIKNWQRSGKDLEFELQKIRETPRRNKRLKQKIFLKFNLSKHIRNLIKISEDFTWWQDERKKATYYNIHIGTKILSEIAKRTGYAIGDLKYAVSVEIPDIVKKGSPAKNTLKKRRECSMFIATNNKIEFITGKNTVSQVKNIMLGNKSYDDISDVRGLTACSGRAFGVVRIVRSVNEIGKVKQGDILVAVMTRPDYVPAMRRAVAIVTDEGGITSHAAIVSREMGTPCIIGTKIATKVFKDGDYVEVDANKGIVRRIKKYVKK